VARILDSLFGDLGFLVEGRDGLGRVDGGRLAHTNLLVVDGTRLRRVDSGGGYTNVLFVGGLVAVAVFTLDLIDSAVLGLVVTVNLDKSLGVGRVRSEGLVRMSARVVFVKGVLCCQRINKSLPIGSKLRDPGIQNRNRCNAAILTAMAIGGLVALNSTITALYGQLGWSLRR
jgi:hypothetical protein